MNDKKIVLFHPYLPEAAKDAARAQMDTRWLGQGSRVDEFEEIWTEKFAKPSKSIAVGSGTDALHLAYILAGIREGDEVVTPLFTCLYGDETILLSNGKYERISSLVYRKYNGEVVSFNEKTKKLENKKVISWYKYPLGKSKWFRISTENALISRSKNGKRGVWVTNDHQFLTSTKGYIRADKLKKNDDLITKYSDFNQDQKFLFTGMMLGDGSIRTGRNLESNCCRFNFGHTENQEEWLDIKILALRGFEYNKSPFPAYKQSKRKFNVTFRAIPRWTIERKKWYEGRKKILPSNLDYKDFNDLTLATWYMDDGAINGGKKYQGNGVAILCTDNFTYEENKKLITILKKIGIKASIQQQVRNKKKKYRLYIGSGNYDLQHNEKGQFIKGERGDNAKKFFIRIAPYILPSMRYKLPREIAQKYPYDKSLWNLGETIPFIDKVIIATGKPNYIQSHLKSVYCIDVKDNHNFISKGLVLHNCTATTTPILYQKAKPIFADIKKDSLNIDPEDVARKVTPRTKAIVCVDYGGLPADLDELQAIADKWQIPLIEDAAQAHGAKYKGNYVGSISDFTAFSFQAIKLIAAPDSGMLTIRNPRLEDKAKRIRWFGIDRKAKQESLNQGIWAGDIWELGYKYQMTDILAVMGIEAMKIIDETLAYQRRHFEGYKKGLEGISGITFIGDDKDYQSSCWLATTLVENRDGLKKKLAENGIESDPVHYRNDRYSIFGKRVDDCPNMDSLEDKYLVLPMHHYVTEEDIDRIISVIKSGW